MNERSLIGGAGDACHGPVWKDPFGTKAGEAARRGIDQLSLALADASQEQIQFQKLKAVMSLGCLSLPELKPDASHKLEPEEEIAMEDSPTMVRVDRGKNQVSPCRGRSCFPKALGYVTGDMKELANWFKNKPVVLQFIDWILRGISQVVFVNNSISGILILVGLLVQNRWWALTGWLGTVVSTLMALLLSQDRRYSKAQPAVGSVCRRATHPCCTHRCVDEDLPIEPTSSGAQFSQALSRWDLPVFTLPFNMALSMYLSATGHFNPFFPGKLVTPVTSPPNISWSDLSALEGEAWQILTARTSEWHHTGSLLVTKAKCQCKQESQGER
ncbi:hypothetical protein P7K49_028003 [Saguinus oedipus]|uniref:Urea transporter 1 n=1 Tax=Saguinus oedipus TaxID=9490 RepID=A0ABQ9UB66_SAGOE|nr:hypothetical protein P7K49_028003 [Saguinus oedipus]